MFYILHNPEPFYNLKNKTATTILPVVAVILSSLLYPVAAAIIATI